MKNITGTVIIVDDEPGMRKALRRLLNAEGFVVRDYASAGEFLRDERPDPPACLVLDIAMPGINGLDVHRQLTSMGETIPVIFLTGHGDIPMSVQAIKAGAMDFLTKPVHDEKILHAVRSALHVAAMAAAENEQLCMCRKRLAKLTPREREVLCHVIAGKLNKQIAYDLGTSEQNVKIHRMRMMAKMEVESVAALVRVAERLGVSPAG